MALTNLFLIIFIARIMNSVIFQYECFTSSVLYSYIGFDCILSLNSDGFRVFRILFLCFVFFRLTNLFDQIKPEPLLDWPCYLSRFLSYPGPDLAALMRQRLTEPFAYRACDVYAARCSAAKWPLKLAINWKRLRTKLLAGKP